MSIERRPTQIMCALALAVACSDDVSEQPETGTDTAQTDSETSATETETGADTDTGAGTDTGTGSELCGNGELDEGEDCDLGDQNADDGACTTACQDAVCGDGLVHAGVEDCDDAGESAACDEDCSLAECGDGQVNAAASEDCDDQNADNGDACLDTCVAASCGDSFLWAGNEECDDGDVVPGDGCSDTCTLEACVWDVDRLTLPIVVWMGQAVIGEIEFDSNCDLIVGGGEELPEIYRVSRADGSVTTAAMNLANGVIYGMAYRDSDEQVYISAGLPDQLYALDDQDQLTLVTDLVDPVTSLAVAPEGFGDFGDHVIAASNSPAQLLAIDPETAMTTAFAQSGGALSGVAFGSDGTLYVAEYDADQISTVTADGVFTPFAGDLDRPDGLAISPDGARMFVAYAVDGGRIDQLSIPGAMLTPGATFEFSAGYAATGVIVDGANHVLYEEFRNDAAIIDVFDAP